MATATITPEQLTQTYLPRVQHALEDRSLDEQWKQIGRLVGKAEVRNFAAAASAQGDAWPPRKDQTQKHPLLILTGQLFLSVTSEFGGQHVENISPRSLEWGTRVPYAGVHEFGSHKKNIPQREFMDVDDETLDECQEILADAMHGVFYE